MKVIAIRENTTGDGEDGYAAVLGICTHKPIGSIYDHLFFYVRWLVQDTDGPDGLMGNMMRYRIESLRSASNVSHKDSSQWLNYVSYSLVLVSWLIRTRWVFHRCPRGNRHISRRIIANRIDTGATSIIWAVHYKGG